MNNFAKLKTLQFVLTCSAFHTSCGPKEFSWTVGDLDKSWNIFQRGKAQLYINEDGAQTLFETNKNFAVMSFDPNKIGFSQSEIIKDHAISYSPLFEDGLRHAIVDITDSTQQSMLEQVAHQHGVFSCGNMRVLLPSYIQHQRLSSVRADEKYRYSPILPVDHKYQLMSTIIEDVSEDRLKSSVDALVALGSRHHSKGNTAGLKVEELFKNQSLVDPSQVSAKSHSLTGQKSVIVSFPGTSQSDEIVIVGAHLDSINSSSSVQDIAPGADDDASGIAVLIETARILKARGMKFKRTIEFHAYAAEEGYLLGSQEVAASYAALAKKVAGMIQLDMMLYAKDKDDNQFYFVKTDTSCDLNRLLKDLSHMYLGGKFKSKELSSGTSDHKAWHDLGYAVGFPFEDPAAYNTMIHTAEDKLGDGLSFSRAKKFAQLALLFLGYHAGYEDAHAVEQTGGFETVSLLKDLNISLKQSDSVTGEFYVAVAGPLEVGAMDFCLSDGSTKTPSCKNERIELQWQGERNERSFFRSEKPVTLPKDQTSVNILLQAYDQDEKSLAKRHVNMTFQPKS